MNQVETQFSMVAFALRYELDELLSYVMRNILVELVKIETVAQITNKLLLLVKTQTEK